MTAVATLSAARDWKRVLAEGGRVRRDGLVVAAAATDPETPARLGVRVKAHGPARAVTRNRVRRRLRHAFREIGPHTGWDVAVTAHPEATGKDFQELAGLLDQALTEVVAR